MDLVRVEVTGENPTHNQQEGNAGVRLEGVHEIDAYAFQEGKWHGLVVFNYGLHQTRKISIGARGLDSKTRASLWMLKSFGPGAGNETHVQVKAEQAPFSGPELALPPCSMAVLEWSE